MLVYFGIFVGFIILLSLYGFWVATHPSKYITNLTPKDLGWEYKDVTLTTSDKVKLSAWFVPAVNKSDQVIILLHGYPADKADLLHWSRFLHNDFNLFFFDFRYFGNSEGSLTTIGFREQKDLQSAIDYLQDRGFTKIGAMGLSLGGSVAIMTAAKDSTGSGLNAIVSESAFANIDLMGHQFYRNFFILKYPLTFLTKLWANILLRVDISSSPEKAAASIKIPVLLIHSKKDATIPFENALRIQKGLQGNPKAEFFFHEEATHGSLPGHLQTEYEKRVIEFFKQNL